MTPKQPGDGAASGPEREDPSAMSLTMASAGDELVLVSVGKGRDLPHRLAELGLTPGVRFRVIASGRPGPFIICVKDSRLVLGRGMVHHMFVKGV